MFERLEQTELRYEELTKSLASPETMNDSAKFQKTAKAHSEIAPIVEKYREYKDLKRGIAESKAMLADETDVDMRVYAEEELAKLEPAESLFPSPIPVQVSSSDEYMPSPQSPRQKEFEARVKDGTAALFISDPIQGTEHQSAINEAHGVIALLMDLAALKGGMVNIARVSRNLDQKNVPTNNSPAPEVKK